MSDEPDQEETGGRRLEVKMAKASDEDLCMVREFFLMLEAVIETGTYDPDPDELNAEQVDDTRLAELIREKWNQNGQGVGNAWFRVVMGYEVLVANCCDPDEPTLDWRPDIRDMMSTVEEVDLAEADKP